jgi:hypothetical protein
MSPSSLAAVVRTALCATTLGVAGGASLAATLPYTAAIGTCTPANLPTLQYDLKLTNGAVRKAGRNPPSSLYFCDVPIDSLASVPTHNRMELQFIDRNTSGSGHVIARLMRRNLQTGVATEVARASSVPSATLRTVGVALPAPMDFRFNEYYVLVSLTTTGMVAVEAHTVRFVTR